MNKEEFIVFLKEKAKENEFLPHWVKTHSNSDDYWRLYKPFMDWLEDDMDLTKEDVVKITFNKSLYDNTSEVFETTYDDFIKNYEKNKK